MIASRYKARDYVMMNIEEADMITSILDAKACEHFYRLRDALADYAYEKLEIEKPLYIGEGTKFSDENMYNEETLAETLDELWSTPSVLDEFISRNPASLGAGDIEVVKSWRTSLQGLFIVFKHEGRILFLRGKTLFEVTGLWDEIETVLKNPDWPVMIETTLLPFRESIVYHGFITIMPVSMGKGMRDMLDSEIEEALRDAEMISGSEDFIRIVPEIKEAEEKERDAREKREAGLAEKGKRQMEGYHRGVLAGLSEAEREEAIETEMKKDIANSRVQSSLIDILKNNVSKGPVTRDLQKLISGEPKGKLQRWAIILGVKVPGKGTKADLISALLPELRENPFLPELTLRVGLNLNQFEAYRKLYETGGVLEITENEITTLAGLPPATSLMCYSFYTKGRSKNGGKFTFVIPEDIMGVLAARDWDEIHDLIVSREAAADIADAVVELRGIAKVDEAYDEFCRFYPSGMERSDFDGALSDAIAEERIGCVWLEADDGSDYLLNYQIGEYYMEKTDPEDELYTEDESGFYSDSFIRGPLEPLGFIIEQQKKRLARPLDEDMLSSRAVFGWKCARPAVRAMRAYLDENVPDSQNDYYYADSVLEDLIDYMTFGLMNGGNSVNDWMEILEEHDYEPNEAHLNRIIKLLMNMYNSIPTWMNNGWAPDELADIMYGRKTFYNEDGSRMKVGRNELCPCGSGKKYKNCCGK